MLDSPLVGEWFVLNGGHTVLLNRHAANESNALDFVRLGANGRTHTGGPVRCSPITPGFGWPLLAPAGGEVAS